MQSKISCFNQTLFRKNLTRFWPLWTVASFLGALAPLAVLMDLVQNSFVYQATPVEVERMMYDVVVYGGPVILLIYSVLCALAVWSFLYNSRSVGLMHTLPITRKGIFITNFLSGMTMILIPCAVTGLLSILVSLLSGGFTPVGFGVTILSVLGMAVFYYSSATLVVFITGNVFAMPVLYFVFHFLAVALDFLLSTLAGGFFFGYRGNYTGAVEALSPTVYMINTLSVNNEYIEVPVPGETWTTQELVSSTLENAWVIAVYALVGLLLLVIAWTLYQHRRSESAGDVVSVGWMKPVFRYGVMLCSAIAGGQLLYVLFWSNYQAGGYYDILPLIICMALAGLIGYYAASMLLAKSLRVFRRSLPGALVTVVTVVVLCFAYDMDILGVEDRIPSADEVENVYFHVSASGSCDATLTDPAAIEAVMAAHRAILAEKDQFVYNQANWDKTSGYAYTRITYYLRNGEKLDRVYNLDYPLEDVEIPGTAMYTVAQLVTRPDVQRANLVPNDVYQFTSGEIYVTDNVSGEVEQIFLDASQTNLLYDAILRDLEAGNFGHTVFLEGAEYEKIIYDDPIYLYYVAKDEDGDTYNKSIDVSISTQCQETVKALRALGLVNDQHVLRTRAQAYGLEKAAEWTDPWVTDAESTSVVVMS